MAITSIKRDYGIGVNIVRVVASNTLAQVSAADYVTSQLAVTTALNHGLWEWVPGDVVLVYASDGESFFTFDGDDFSTFILYSTAGNGAVTLPVVAGNFTVFDGAAGALEDAGFAPSNPAGTTVVMAGAPVLVNHIAVFTDTAGSISDDAATAINGGNIQAGLSGTAGTLASFPATAANGSLILSALNAGGAFNTTVRNSAMTQSTVYSIPNVSAATGFLVANATQGLMKSVSAAVVAGGAASQVVTDAFCTALSTVVANWNTSANAVSIQKVTPGAGSFTVLSSGDPGASTLGYVIMK